MTGPRRLVVVGDVLLDRDVTGDVERICPDAPVPVLDVTTRHERPGGAGLAALLCRAPDVEVTLVAPLAEDDPGQRLRRMLDEAGVRLVALDHQGGTRTKTRLRSAGHSLLRVDDGGPGTPRGALPDAARDAVWCADAVLVSDYGAGTTAHGPVRGLLEAVARRRGGAAHRVCWDPHPKGADPVPGCALVTPNLAEARVAAGALDVEPADAAHQLREAWHAEGVCVTTGHAGAWLATSAGAPLFVPSPGAALGDPCGAGDRFAATAARALAHGALLSEAVQRAVAEATAWVQAGGAEGYRPLGTPPAPPSDPYSSGPGASGPGASGASGPAAAAVVARVRAGGGRVVATGGCFDVIHAGHIASLAAARSLGDALVVLVNSDASVRRLKGPGRPVHRQDDRVAVLEALAGVDAVLVFDGDDPREALAELRPDVWAKGGDYTDDALPEADLVRGWGGRVVILPYLPGRSTSAAVDALS